MGLHCGECYGNCPGLHPLTEAPVTTPVCVEFSFLSLQLLCAVADSFCMPLTPGVQAKKLGMTTVLIQSKTMLEETAYALDR